MLRTINSSPTNRSISMDSINGMGSGKMIVETRNKKPRTKFLTPRTNVTFVELWQAFCTTPIVYYFDPKWHIHIGMNILGYAINDILIQLTLHKLGWRYSIVFFSENINPADTWYKTHNNKLLALVTVFKSWLHYLDSCKYEISFIMDPNNLSYFMNKKNPSFGQVVGLKSC